MKGPQKNSPADNRSIEELTRSDGLLNSTGMAAGYTMGMDPEGREHLLVAVKGTFNLPTDSNEPMAPGERVRLDEVDIYNGETGFFASLHKIDYQHRLNAERL